MTDIRVNITPHKIPKRQVDGADTAYPAAISALLFGLVLGWALGASDDVSQWLGLSDALYAENMEEKFDWHLAALAAGPFIIAAAVLYSAALLIEALRNT